MSRDGQTRHTPRSSLIHRLRSVRNYLLSVQAACIVEAAPEPGHVLLVDEAGSRRTGIPPGGYGMIAGVGESALLCPLRLTRFGELEFTDRLITVSCDALSSNMIVGRDSMIVPLPAR